MNLLNKNLLLYYLFKRLDLVSKYRSIGRRVSIEEDRNCKMYRYHKK